MEPMAMEEFKRENTMTVKEFVNLKDEKGEAKAESFDFSDDGASEAYQKIKKDSIKKFFVYHIFITEKLSKDKKTELLEKILDTDVTDIHISDPDSNSNLLQDIYQTLWKKEYLESCMKNGKIKGETMNSANTTFGRLYFLKKLDKNGYYGTITRINHYVNNSKSLQDSIKKTNFEAFISAYHTIGNFIPFPVDCNGPRGFKNAKIGDYWDLTLRNICEFYKSNKKEKRFIQEITNHKYKLKNRDNTKLFEERTNRFIDWLDSFGSWENFVKANYLEAFVKDNYPKELWGGHFKGNVLPKDEQQCIQYFKNATEMIKARSKLMIDELKKKDYNIR